MAIGGRFAAPPMLVEWRPPLQWLSHPGPTFDRVVSDHFSQQFKTAAERLSADRPELWDGIVQTLVYLREFRRGAVAPDIRWEIGQSVYGPNCGELRWPDPEIQRKYPADAWRGLFVAHPEDDWYVFTVLGNKAGLGNRWYDLAVSESDALVQVAVSSLRLTPPIVE